MARRERRLAAIVATDVVGYARLMGRDESGTLASLKTLRSTLIDPEVNAYGGRIFKTIGDGLLVEFASAVDAMQCVVGIQRAMAEQTKGESKNRRIILRIGVNLGDVIVEDDDVFGDGVIVAARLQALARPGGVCLSNSVYEEVRDRLDFSFEDAGERSLKNIVRPVHVWLWSSETAILSTHIDPSDVVRSLVNKPSIAVLPFLNLSREPDQDYFAEGVAEDIIAALSKFHELLVVARSSSFAFKGSNLNTEAIARQLGVQYVLGGSIRRAGARIRLTAELTSAHNGIQVWSDRYDRELIDVFALQDDISRSVAAVIHPAVRGAEIERARRMPLESLTAYDLYLRALPHVWAGTREAITRAIDLLRQSLAYDGSNASCLAMLAYCLQWAPILGAAAGENELRESLTLARQAVGRDATDAFAQAHYGQGLAWIAGDCAQALLHTEESIRLNPSLAFAWYARGFVGMQANDFAHAVECLQLAIRLSPADTFLYWWVTCLSAAHFALERHAEGIEAARKAVQRNPDFGTAHRLLAANLALGGQLEEAREVTRQRDLVQTTTLAQIKTLHLFRGDDVMERYLKAQRACGVPD